MNFLKKNYMNISIVFFVLAVYVILFPVISKFLTAIFPTLGVCPYLVMTGKPCPLCGGTRYIANLGQALQNPKYLCHPFGIMVLFVAFELLFRIFCFIQIKRKKPLDKIVLFDLVIHILAFTSFILYEIFFLLYNWKWKNVKKRKYLLTDIEKNSILIFVNEHAPLAQLVRATGS